MGIICTHALRIIVSNLFDTIALELSNFTERWVVKNGKRRFEIDEFIFEKIFFRSRLYIWNHTTGKWYRIWDSQENTNLLFPFKIIKNGVVSHRASNNSHNLFINLDIFSQTIKSNLQSRAKESKFFHLFRRDRTNPKIPAYSIHGTKRVNFETIWIHIYTYINIGRKQGGIFHYGCKKCGGSIRRQILLESNLGEKHFDRRCEEIAAI